MPTTSAALSRFDVQGALRDHRGNDVFEEVLETVHSRDLLRVLGRYIQFNSVFGSGVAHLAGEIGNRQELFRDSAERCELLADRSSEVAAEVFFAAIDEFGDHTVRRRGTHRTIAQATLRAVAAYFGADPTDLNQPGFINAATWEAIRAVRAGYGFCGVATDDRVLRGIGFHVASETLADGEFCLLDRMLRRRFPELVSWLESRPVTAGGRETPAYLWIHVHTFAEAEHSDAALTGLERSLLYYRGLGGQERAGELLLAGMHEFAELQTAFMQQLLN